MPTNIASQIVIGDHDYNVVGETFLDERSIKLLNIIVHEDYGKVVDAHGKIQFTNDVALLELDEEVDISDYKIPFSSKCLTIFFFILKKSI